MVRLRALFVRVVWDVVEIAGLGVLVFAAFTFFGRGWGLLALGFVLVAIANIRGR